MYYSDSTNTTIVNNGNDRSKATDIVSTKIFSCYETDDNVTNHIGDFLITCRYANGRASVKLADVNLNWELIVYDMSARTVRDLLQVYPWITSEMLFEMARLLADFDECHKTSKTESDPVGSCKIEVVAKVDDPNEECRFAAGPGAIGSFRLFRATNGSSGNPGTDAEPHDINSRNYVAEKCSDYVAAGGHPLDFIKGNIGDVVLQFGETPHRHHDDTWYNIARYCCKQCANKHNAAACEGCMISPVIKNS